ncbi:MAG: chorismate synthase [Bacillota bacterium]|nr:chorismate synthase [Bacillota bacterium]
MRYLSGGESHGPCLTGIVEGLPSGLIIKLEEINHQLSRRQQGYGRGGRMSIEKDRVEVISGLRFNRTIGSPLTLQIQNRDWENWKHLMGIEGEIPPDLTLLTRPRPGHADLAGGLKYNHDDLRLVLERSSARETAMRVAVGTIGRILIEKYGIRIYSHVARIGSVASDVDQAKMVTLYDDIEKSPVRCADPSVEGKMIEAIELARSEGDTLGGIIELQVTNIPPGLGSHVHWDRKIDGRLAGALCSIQGVKGVEFGIGFAGSSRRGSEVHDPLMSQPFKGIVRPSNRAGGIEGGITNGQNLVIRIAMKPIPTLTEPLPSVDWLTGEESRGSTERSDVCAVPAASVVAEAVIAWELAVAFREKFAGDFIEEVDSAYTFYLNQVNKRLRRGS